jgi:curved DNA-binding protein CbpA
MPVGVGGAVMTDYFALLGQPRRPWLEPVEIQKAFVTAAHECHPDRLHGATDEERGGAQTRYTALNQACRCLGKPHTRLRHLIELERGRKVSDLHEMAPELMALFGEVGGVCRNADRFLSERNAVQSPLLKVALLERGETLREQLESVRHKVQAEVTTMETRLKALDRAWVEATSAVERERLLKDLEGLFRLFSFHDRWLSQLQTRWLQLVA